MSIEHPFEVWRLGPERPLDARVSDHTTLGGARAAVAALREQDGSANYEIRKEGRPIQQRGPKSTRGTLPSSPAARPKSSS